MTLPSSIEPFLEPETGWRHGATPADQTAGTILASAVSALVLVGLMWEDVARNGPWTGVPGPLELAGLPVPVSAGWLLAGTAAALGVGAWLARRPALPPPAAAEAAAGLPRLPVFVRFDGRRVVVVGGGAVAASKIPALVGAGAEVTVIAPDVVPAIERTGVRVVRRAFAPTDLDGAWFVTAAATPEVNRQVREAADARAVFVNAVDDPANATAYLGGTIVRGGVTVAFSTSGRAPALAGLLREAFDEIVPEDIDVWVARAHEVSRRQRADGVPMAERRPQLLEALNRLYDGREAAQAGAGAGARS
jgi:siroheme synthase-like protein